MSTESVRGEYKEFRRLLRNGIGDRSQKKFAEETGISKEHLNRMLNNKEINRPTADTLAKIAAAMNTVTLDDLLIACGYDAYDIKSQAIKAAGEIKAALNEILSDPLKGWKTVNDAVETANMLYTNNLKCKFRIINTKPCEETQEHHWAEAYSILEFKWKEGDYSCKTWAILFYTETKNGRIIPTDCVMNLESLLKHNAVTENMASNKARSVLGEDGMYIYIRNIKKPTDNDIKEARLFSWLFPGEGRYVTTEIGYGFLLSMHAGWIQTVPDGACRILLYDQGKQKVVPDCHGSWSGCRLCVRQL